MQVNTIRVAVLQHLLGFKLIGIANWRPDGFGVATDANGLIQIGLGNVWVGGAGSTSRIREKSLGMARGGSEFWHNGSLAHSRY